MNIKANFESIELFNQAYDLLNKAAQKQAEEVGYSPQEAMADIITHAIFTYDAQLGISPSDKGTSDQSQESIRFDTNLVYQVNQYLAYLDKEIVNREKLRIITRYLEVIETLVRDTKREAQ